ncbi:RHS repeat-associated core domain-containing protein, partial [Neolewinella lacunae]
RTSPTGAVTVQSVLDYYPFGMVNADRSSGAGTYAYKFNGIERVDELGLDMAVFRNYDPAVGRWMQVDPKAEKYYNMSPYNGMGNNPIMYSDQMGDTIRINGSEEFRINTLNDLALIENSSDAGAELLNFLRATPEDITISEVEPAGIVESVLGGGKNAATIKKSSTKRDLKSGEVSISYSQLDGIEIDGVISQPDETLNHELVHAQDFIKKTVDNDPSIKGKGPGVAKGLFEARAVQQTNSYRKAKNPNATIRQYYGGKQVVTPQNEIIPGVEIWF